MLSPLRLKDKLFYGWVVVVAFFLVTATLLGTRFSYGVFFKSIAIEFNLTRATTSAVFSVYMLLGCFFAILAGLASDRYGPRIIVLLMGLFTGLSLLLTSQTNSPWQLFIAYSLLMAMGTGATFVVTMSTVSRWFDNKRGLALGIASSGIGMGTMIMAPFATYLISKLSWRMAYLVMGLIAWLIVIPSSRLLKRNPQEIGALPDGAKLNSKDRLLSTLKNEDTNNQPIGFSLLQAFRTRSFWLFMFIWLLFAFCTFLVFTHIVPHATDIGFSAGEAATVLSLISGTSIVGRVLMGIASDRIGRKRIAIICSLLQAGAMVWLIWSPDLWMFYLFAVIYGFGYSGIAPSMVALISATFGLRKMGIILGVLDVGFAIGAATGPFIGGLIFDVSNSYFLAFLLGAVAMLVVTILILLIKQETRTPISS